MAKFFESDADGTGLSSVVEEGTKFSFSGAGNNFAHDLAENIDGTIVWWRWSCVGKDSRRHVA